MVGGITAPDDIVSPRAAESPDVLPLTETGASMDLNYLYKRHQISLFRSRHAASAQARRAHRGLTEGYAALIDTLKKEARR